MAAPGSSSTSADALPRADPLRNAEGVVNPVVAYLGLSLSQGHRPRADLGLELGLERIFDVRSDLPTVGQGDRVRLRPEVLRIGRIAAQLQRDEMVLFVRRGPSH